MAAPLPASAFGAHAHGAWARYANLALGILLVISALLGRDTLALRTGAWSLGALVGFFALWAMASPRARFANTVLGAWLFIWSITAAQVSRAEAAFDMICGVLIFALSLVPGPSEPERRRLAWPPDEEESGMFSGDGRFRRE